jgi:hypothetical protein
MGKKTSSLFDKGMGVVDSIGDGLSKIKENALDYVPEIDFDYIETKLTNIGYKIPKLEIKISIPPSISLEIDLDKSIVNKLEQDKIINDIDFKNKEETETNKVLVKILQGLEYAAKMNNKIKLKNKVLSRVLIEGSIIPSVKLIYLDKDIISETYLRDNH